MADDRQETHVSPKPNPGIPRIPSIFLSRTRLSSRFAEALEHYQTVLLIAPNGYGKTALIAHSLSDIADPVAWVTVDDRTSTPEAFFRMLIGSIGRVADGFESALVQGDGISGGPKEVEAVDEAYLDLADAIDAMVPELCLVIDGYERVCSDRVDRGIDRLMERLPSRAHLIIAAASQPRFGIVRMEVAGRLTTIRTADLAFGTDEVSELYNGLIGLGLSEEALDRINTQMDGWAAGLRMAEVALRNGASVEAVLSAGSESQRSISAYLTDDIVDRQDGAIRRFLFESSMFDSFSAELCDDAFGRADSAEMIGRILEGDLFLQPVGVSGWFRYANFFKTCLEDIPGTISEDERSAIRSRASRWFARQGRYEQALEQALEANDYDQVIALLDHDYATMMGQDDSIRVRQLIMRLPEDIVRRSLWTNISAAVACEMQQCFTQEDTYVQAALEHFGRGTTASVPSTDRDLTLRASFFIMQMLDAYHRDDLGRVLKIGQDWLDEGAPDQRGRCGILNVMGMAHWRAGSFDRAQSCWQESAMLATYIDWPYSICLNLFGVAHVHYQHGRFESAEEVCRQIFAISDCREQPVLSSGYAHALLAKIHYDRNELDQARAEIGRARRIADVGCERPLAMHAEMALARIEVAGGKCKEGIERARWSFSEFCADPQYRSSFGEARRLMAQIWLLAGKADLACDFLENFEIRQNVGAEMGERIDEAVTHDVFGDDFRNIWGEAPLFDYLFYLIQSGQMDDALPWLDRVQQEAGSREISHLVVQVLILKALCAAVGKDDDAAIGYLAESSVLAEPSGSVRVYLDAGEPMEQLMLKARRKKLSTRFGDGIIAEFVADRAVPDQICTDFGQIFTRREREVMQLLCTGATNDEMTKRLFLSLSTVKNHLHGIYLKLGVRNRAEAIVRLRELGFTGDMTEVGIG